MEKILIANLEGKVSACSERREAFLYEFLNKRDGIIDEECHDLISLLEEFNGEEVEITIKMIY